MALPKLNDSPKYSLVIPSSGKKVKFRPYLIKEEKVLLMTAQENDISTTMDTIINTICSCVDEPLNKRELTTFDIEYMFIKIRSKSVGEIVDLGLKCDACEETNRVDVNLEEIQCKIQKKNNIIQLTDSITVEMRYPSYSSIEYTDDENELGFEIIANSIKAVITEDERIETDDEPKESVRAFLESMTKDQFERIGSYVEDLPQMKHDVDYVCKNCGHKNHVELKGMQSFF